MLKWKNGKSQAAPLCLLNCWVFGWYLNDIYWTFMNVLFGNVFLDHVWHQWLSDVKYVCVQYLKFIKAATLSSWVYLLVIAWYLLRLF